MSTINITLDSAESVRALFADNKLAISRNWYSAWYGDCSKGIEDIISMMQDLYLSRENKADQEGVCDILAVYVRECDSIFEVRQNEDSVSIPAFKALVETYMLSDRYCEIYAQVYDYALGRSIYVVYGMHESAKHLFINKFQIVRHPTMGLDKVNRIDLAELWKARQAAADKTCDEMADPRVTKLFNDYIPEVSEMIKAQLTLNSPNNVHRIYIPRKDCPEWEDVSMQAFSQYVYHVAFGPKPDGGYIEMIYVDYDAQFDMTVIGLKLKNADMKTLH